MLINIDNHKSQEGKKWNLKSQIECKYLLGVAKHNQLL